MLLVPEPKTKEERKINQKQEFKFLGSGRYRKGLSLFAYDPVKDEIYKVEFAKKETINFDRVLRKSNAKYKAIINPEHYHFWALNAKNAERKALKIKEQLKQYYEQNKA